MRRRSARGIAALAILAALAGLGPASCGNQDERAELVRAASGLNAGELAGLRTIVSYSGLEPPTELFRMIRRGKAGGVIFFSENLSADGNPEPADAERLRGIARQLQRALRRSRLPRVLRERPLLLMADQEGGQVRRLPGAPEPSAAAIGLATDPQAAAAETGRGAARTLRQAGMNVDLAPVLGVLRPSGSLLADTERAYGSDAERVGSIGASFIGAMQERGVAATAKHFPGLGAAARNTDERPVTIAAPAAELHSVDERPYADAIDAGVRIVMLSNAVYPALDSERPASLSPAVIAGELRDRLGFDGVTMPDALEAGALEEFGDLAERGLAAARAGNDLLLFSGRDLDEGRRGFAEVREALLEARLGRTEAIAAAVRVLELREALGAGDPLPAPVPGDG